MVRGSILPLAAAAILSALCLPRGAAGHGMLTEPAARNVLSYQAGLQYDPQSFSAGGTGVVGAGGAVWPAGQHGICGDPAPSDRPHEAGGRFFSGAVTGSFTEGQVANLTVRLTANHMGRFGFRICRVEGAGVASTDAVGADVADEREQLSEACLGRHTLLQASNPDAQAPGQSWWYVPRGQFLFNMPYQLPQGLTCDGSTTRCVLQWYYTTGNSCDPPGTPAPYSNPQLGTCGSNAPYPEEFWNCADIRIRPAGGGGATPPTSPPPSPFPSPSPDPPSPPPVPQRPPPPAPPRPPPPPSPRPPLTPPPSFPRPPMPLPPTPLTARPPPPATTARSPPPQAIARPSPPPPPTSAPIPAATFCAGKAAGFYADLLSGCKGYYRCEASGSWYFSCAPGLLFNQLTRACDWSTNVSCPVARSMRRRRRLLSL